MIVQLDGGLAAGGTSWRGRNSDRCADSASMRAKLSNRRLGPDPGPTSWLARRPFHHASSEVYKSTNEQWIEYIDAVSGTICPLVLVVYLSDVPGSSLVCRESA